LFRFLLISHRVPTKPSWHWHCELPVIQFPLIQEFDWHEPLLIVDIVVLGVIVEPEIHGDGGKQVHCATPDVICCKQGHDAIVQFIVKQASKFKND